MINFNFIRYCYTYTKAGLPVVSIPKYIEANLAKYKKNQEKRLIEKQRKIAARGTQNLLISSKHKPQLNHHLNQTYSKRHEVILASHGWKKPKHKNDIITFHPFMNKPHFNDANALSSDFNFYSLGLCSTITESLSNLNITKPTNIQITTIPRILSKKSLLCSAETGSGKTLAYLAPLLDTVFRFKKDHGNIGERSPLVLILLPSRELVEQVGLLAQKLGSYCGIGVGIMMGGPPKRLTHTGYDIVVSTVGIMDKHVKHGNVITNNLSFLI
jgi:DEAD-box ATP-dependent RNA helicase 39